MPPSKSSILIFPFQLQSSTLLTPKPTALRPLLLTQHAILSIRLSQASRPHDAMAMLHTTAHLHASRHKFCVLPIILVGEVLEQDTPDREGEDKSADEASHERELGAQAAHGTVREFCSFWVHKDVIVSEVAHCGSILVGWEVDFLFGSFVRGIA